MVLEVEQEASSSCISLEEEIYGSERITEAVIRTRTPKLRESGWRALISIRSVKDELCIVV